MTDVLLILFHVFENPKLFSWKFSSKLSGCCPLMKEFSAEIKNTDMQGVPEEESIILSLGG